MLPTKQSASNALYRGEARDFVHAMALVQEAVAEEIKLGLTPGDVLDEVRDGSLAAYARAAAKCQAEYIARVRAVETELALKWQRSVDEDVRRIGEALATGDYSELAI